MGIKPRDSLAWHSMGVGSLGFELSEPIDLRKKSVLVLELDRDGVGFFLDLDLNIRR